MSDDEIQIRVVSMYGHEGRQPLVVLTIGDHMTTLAADKAKEIGGMLIETAMAADADAFIFEYAAESRSDQAAVRTLRAFREWRQQRADRGGQ